MLHSPPAVAPLCILRFPLVCFFLFVFQSSYITLPCDVLWVPLWLLHVWSH